MKKNTLIRTVIVGLTVTVVSLYFSAPWVPIAYRYLRHWWRWEVKYKQHIPTADEMRRYYENLPAPGFTSEQVIAQMKEQKGLLRGNTKLIKQVEWYVYLGDKRVIKQLVANLPFEVDLILPSEQNNFKMIFKDTIGKSLSILGNSSGKNTFEMICNDSTWESYRNFRNGWDPDVNNWYPKSYSYSVISQLPHITRGLLIHISPVLHEELHQQAANEITDPNFIYLLLKLIESNEPRITKAPSGENKVYVREKTFYANTDWYTDQLVREDVLAYLRIYANYKDWPIIRGCVRSRLLRYPGDWLASIDMMEVISLADKKGVEPAYELYLKQYNSKEKSVTQS